MGDFGGVGGEKYKIKCRREGSNKFHSYSVSNSKLLVFILTNIKPIHKRKVNYFPSTSLKHHLKVFMKVQSCFTTKFFKIFIKYNFTKNPLPFENPNENT